MNIELAKKLISDEELLSKLPHPISLAGKNISKEKLNDLADTIRIDMAKKKINKIFQNKKGNNNG